MNLFVGIIILVLVIFAGIFGGAALKRSRNAKLCQSGYYCILIGPDRTWMKVLPAQGGLIIKPDSASKKKFYKKNEPEIPWATSGYIVPKEGPVPTIPWPVEAHSSTQVSVGMLIYHVGCAMPLGYDENGKFTGYGTLSGAAPEIIESISNNQDTQDLFSEAASEPSNAPVGSPKSNVWNIIILIGIAISIIIGIMTYISVTGGFTHINNGFGI
jgi:hypothetical protein